MYFTVLLINKQTTQYPTLYPCPDKLPMPSRIFLAFSWIIYIFNKSSINQSIPSYCFNMDALIILYRIYILSKIHRASPTFFMPLYGNDDARVKCRYGQGWFTLRGGPVIQHLRVVSLHWSHWPRELEKDGHMRRLAWLHMSGKHTTS